MTAVRAVTLRLEPIAGDAGRKFHADYVTIRLLTTLVGCATQWIAVERPDDIGALETGDIALVKGRLLQEPPIVLHRSPPIERSGERRLLLAIDPTDPDAAL